MQIINLKKIKYILRNNLNYFFHLLTRILFPFRPEGLVTIIPHEGLGDLISIIPALQFLHNKGVEIKLVADEGKWCQIKNAFMAIPDVQIIQMQPNENYSKPLEVIRDHRKNLVPLGYYANFGFIKDYPYSFFWQLSVKREVMSNFLSLKSCKLDFQLPENYDFIDLGTSKGILNYKYFSKAQNKLVFLNNTDLVVNQSGSELHLSLNYSVSFHQKIFIALRSKVIICSDAALFNAVIRMSRHPKIIVHTRKHYHSHSKEIYGNCKFNGGVYEFPARNI